MKPGAARAPAAGAEPVANPDVMPKDHVFFRHPKGPHAGEVTATGKHGITVTHEGKPHRVKWEHVLGHKTRAPQTYDVLEEGEDGLLVKDAAGKRKYMNVPPEARGEKMVLEKSFRSGPTGGRLIIFAKAGPIANRPGLSLQQKTDKNGKASKHWVRTNKPLPKVGGPGAEPDETAAAPTHVAFENGAHRGHGKVISSGKHGHVVEDDAGGKHRILHEQVTHQWHGTDKPDGHPDASTPPAKPDWAPRGDGESDKGYAKRVVDKGAEVKHLPEEHDRYFNTKGSKHVPLDKLHSTKSDDENKQGGDNGPKRMLAAYHGALGKRDPITVMPHKDKDGHFEVVDGNGTLTSAKNMGWKGLPTKHVTREEGEKLQAEDAAKDSGKAKTADDIAHALFSNHEMAKLPAKAFQPVNSWEQLSAKAPEALEQFKSMLGEVASKLDLEQGKRPQSLALAQAGEDKKAKAEGREPEKLSDTDYMLPEHWGNDKGFLFMGPLKGEERASAKVKADYKGDWSQVRDMVRATIAVPMVTQIPKVLEQLKAAGIELAQKPKNNLIKPLPGGYRDVNLIVKMPNGLLAELQIHIKPMTLAKEAGHKPYEVTRKISDKYKESGTEDDPSKWDEADRVEHEKAMAEQEKLYGDAWNKASGKDKPSSNLTKSHKEPIIVLLRNESREHGRR